MSDHPFQVALSFAGEQREYVRAVASELAARGVTHFYDEDQTVELWGRDLNEALQEVYRDRARFVVMFVSEAYAAKAWPTRERRAAFESAVTSIEDRILPVRFDDTDIPGLSRSISYVSVSQMSPVELAETLCRKLISVGESVKPRSSRSAPRSRPVSTRLMSVTYEMSGATHLRMSWLWWLPQRVGTGRRRPCPVESPKSTWPNAAQCRSSQVS